MNQHLDLATAHLVPELQDERFLKWFESRDSLVDRAIAATAKSQSYRSFRVGCAVLAYRTDAPSGERFRVFVGANVKVSKDARPVCAEAVAILSAYHAGYDCIIGLVVVGGRNEDHESGLVPETLHSCGECRKLMKFLKARDGTNVVSSETRMLFVRVDSALDPENPEGTDEVPDTMIEEEMSFAELCEQHRNGNGNGNGNGHGK